jgi:hypothetical protein
VARCGWSDCGRWRPDALVRRMRYGLTMNDNWYCAEVCAEHAIAEELAATAKDAPSVRARPLPPLKLGMLLVHQGAISPADLRAALEAQKVTGRRLGEQLLTAGATDEAAVVKALAGQAGVPFVASLDPGAVRACPELLGADAVRALGLVPFGVDPDRRRLKVATTAPLPRLAIAALNEITGWTAEPFLVADRALPLLLDAYARACEGHAESTLTVSTVDEAAARVAHEAARTPGATVQKAPCDPYLWVRIQGKGPARDVFVIPNKEIPWLAVPTSR